MTARWMQAADWLQRIDRNDLSEEEYQAWANWCAQSRENDRAFAEMRGLYRALRAAPQQEREALRRLAGSAPHRVDVRRWWSTAASLVLIVGAALLGWRWLHAPPA